ncbi:transketolase C-terminal domain-containing protein [Motiliproteus sp. MSK22-1]|uniref:alpha-ketoacid dehydrogenase subunit alpha/beta n=1 Tax=Motiliproteus sp. MSK22-1 TaxID=1897630 RepID=UPI0009FAD375|nr:transketolase C-terminal domain-containing protein [Motiliproteus sp. MSK22-1]
MEAIAHPSTVDGLTGSNTTSQSAFDWKNIARVLLVSRAMDDIEEQELVPAKLVFNQFSARGHDLAQILLGSLLTHPHDGATGYYRSRPFVLSLGLDMDEAVASPMAKSGGYSDGRDIGVVCNYPNTDRKGAMLFPMCGGVGAQYSPIAGWAQSIVYHRDQLNDESYQGAIGVSMGGDSSMSTSGFWASLNISTTNNLPHLFYIEDNGYGISVPQTVQTPGGDQVANLTAYKNLKIIDGDGTDPVEAPALIKEAVDYVRSGQGTCLLRLRVPRLCGHTFQDTQVYKPAELLAKEQANDPLPKLRAHLKKQGIINDQQWQQIEQQAYEEVRASVERAKLRPEPDTSKLTRYVYAEKNAHGQMDIQLRGGLYPDGHQFPPTCEEAKPDGPRINMLTAIRKVLDYELETNPKVLVFGEDVGPKGGVHAATLGLNEKYGDLRVFDTSLSEEGIIGRSVGMALAGLMPVPEIQFRKYAEPAAEQITDTGIMRWRTNNQFAAPMVVRIPGGFAGRGDPWHSMSDEVEWAHKTGWQIAMPSNAEDAAGLLRYALRDNNPTIFFEHRSLLDGRWARRPYPGDDYVVPFGKAHTLISGDNLTVVCWGAMVERCEEAATKLNMDIEVIDLRTIQPWDQDTVLTSVQKTSRCLIVHEDNLTAGFGAEIAAVLAKEAFFDLDAPIERLAMPNTPVPHNIHLLEAAVPTSERIGVAMKDLIEL